MKYDDASWHYGGDFPDDLPEEAGGTHTGMFLAWAILTGLGGEDLEEYSETIEALHQRSLTPGQLFFQFDGKFTDSDLNDEGNRFTQDYFDFDRGQYLADYEKTLANGLPSTYHVEDSWQNFDKLKPILDQRFHEWQEGN